LTEQIKGISKIMLAKVFTQHWDYV